MSTLGQLLSSRRKRMVCFVRRAEMSLSVRCCQTTEFFGTHSRLPGSEVRRNQRRGLAEYFVSLYPKPMQANYHHERIQHVGTGDFHYCNNWSSS